MATHCNVGIVNPDGTISFIYCHNDGYPQGVGRMLGFHYQDEAKVRELIALGDCSTIEPEVAPRGPHSYEKPEAGVTVAYGRDRGEKHCETRTVHQSVMRWDQTYNYLFTPGKGWETQ